MRAGGAEHVTRLPGGAEVRVHADLAALAADAADLAAAVITAAIDRDGRARVMFASGNSQRAFLAALGGQRVDWSRVQGFHMDEYVGVGPDDPRGFAHYMRVHVVDALGVTDFEVIDGRVDPEREAARYAALLAEEPLDLCCLGIGENGHLAFNDPPVADFADPLTVKVVELDEACKRQQVGEGHFADVASVPPRAITVTIPALLAAARVLVVAPESRKAEPVARALAGPVTTACPASILQRVPHATVLLDAESASQWLAGAQ